MNRAPVLAGLFAMSLLAPGYSTALFHGVPLGVAGLVGLTIAVFALLLFAQTMLAAVPARRLAAAVIVLTVVKVALAALAPRPGWLSQQYVNDRFEGAAQASTEFSIPGSTRIDARLDFADDYLPVYFLNEAHYNRGMRREVTFPLSIRWTGYISPEQAATRSVTIAARGTATLLLDGTPLVWTRASREPASTTKEVTFARGPHVLTLNYAKPADVDPLVRLHGFDEAGGGDMLVTSEPAAPNARRLARWAAPVSAALDVATVAAGVIFGVLLWRASRGPIGWRALVQPRPLAAAMFVLLVSQGVYKSWEHIGKAETLMGGDDWMAFEARAREVITGGLLMDFGAPRGQGEVFYYYPFYSYFLAAVHKLTGEDLFGPIFVHFVLLVATNVVAYRLGRRLFGPRAALGAVAALVLIEQLAFVRHYSVQLLSENLYFFTVALTLDRLVAFVDDGRRFDLACAGFAAGVSAITRPAMMAYLPFAVGIVVVASWNGPAGLRRAGAAAAILLVSWFAVVSLMTVRNYIVAGSIVLINNNPARAIILYNLPAVPNSERFIGGDETLVSALRVLSRIAIEEPRAFLTNVAIKVGFSLGVLELMKQRFHPELILASAGYLASLIWLPAARSLRTWPIHAFVAAHLAGLMMTMPSNYGYRLILPMYVFFPIFGAALVDSRLAAGRPVRANAGPREVHA